MKKRNLLGRRTYCVAEAAAAAEESAVCELGMIPRNWKYADTEMIKVADFFRFKKRRFSLPLIIPPREFLGITFQRLDEKSSDFITLLITMFWRLAI